MPRFLGFTNKKDQEQMKADKKGEAAETILFRNTLASHGVPHSLDSYCERVICGRFF